MSYLHKEKVRVLRPKYEQDYTPAYNAAAKLLEVLLKDIDSEVLQRTADFDLLILLFPPDRALAEAFEKLPDIREKLKLGRKDKQAKRGLTISVAEDGHIVKIFMLVGVENIVELSPDVPVDLRFKKEVPYSIFIHELGHVIYNGGFDQKQKYRVTACFNEFFRKSHSDRDFGGFWKDASESSSPVFSDKDPFRLPPSDENNEQGAGFRGPYNRFAIQEPENFNNFEEIGEYFAKSWTLWFGVYGGQKTFQGWFFENDGCLGSFFKSLFNGSGPYPSSYLTEQMGRFKIGQD